MTDTNTANQANTVAHVASPSKLLPTDSSPSATAAAAAPLWVHTTEHIPSRFNTTPDIGSGHQPSLNSNSKAMLDCCREEHPLNRFDATKQQGLFLRRASYSGSALDRIRESQHHGGNNCDTLSNSSSCSDDKSPCK